ncbi:tRNA-His guanylyltransferase [Blastocladiella emersonii ATCC 22665]|nr:tRNA-His guanylyltransferase [Blastocladiella emersonii ATCC 22665]
MAKSKYEYVKEFETNAVMLRNTWVVVRVDGKGFHKFSKNNDFVKPNDEAALRLMNYAATKVMEEFDDLTLAYGQSDEYSFLFRRSTELYNRRERYALFLLWSLGGGWPCLSLQTVAVQFDGIPQWHSRGQFADPEQQQLSRGPKLATVLGSMFTAYYVHGWPQFFPSKPLLTPPAFDSRAVSYPSTQNVRDYFSWRQADCHINNLNNTVYWSLVLRGGLDERAATKRLQGTQAKDKNEILFSEFGINYAKEPEMFRKGTTLFKQEVQVTKESRIPAKHARADFETVRVEGEMVVQMVTRMKMAVCETTEDIIGDEFWAAHPDAIRD